MCSSLAATCSEASDTLRLSAVQNVLGRYRAGV